MKRWLTIIALAIVSAVAGMVGFTYLTRPITDAATVAKPPPIDIASTQSRAQSGDAKAQVELARLYAKGDDLGVGVAVDRVEALKWFILAAAQGQVDAADRRDKLKKELTKDQITEAHRRVAEFGRPH